MRRILAAVAPGEVRIALLEDDVLCEAWVQRAGHFDGVGDVYRARVASLAPAMAGAFVDLGGGQSGFLPESGLPGPRQPIQRALHEGQMLALRVTRAAQGGKGARLTARLSPEEVALAAAGAPRLLRRGPTTLQRLVAQWPDAVVETDGAALAAALRREAAPLSAPAPHKNREAGSEVGPEKTAEAGQGGNRVLLTRQAAFPAEIEEEWEALGTPSVPLPGGGRLLIHATPALTAIDVDTGSLSGARDAETQRRVNEAALAEAARQIRLRNLAGAVVIDLAGLRPKAREALLPAFKHAAGGDSLLKVVGISGLGLLEAVRTRVFPPLHEVLGEPIAPLAPATTQTLALTALRLAARESAAQPGRALALRAHPAILRALEAMPAALEEYRQGAGRALALRSDSALAPGEEGLEEAT